MTLLKRHLIEQQPRQTVLAVELRSEHAASVSRFLGGFTDTFESFLRTIGRKASWHHSVWTIAYVQSPLRKIGGAYSGIVFGTRLFDESEAIKVHEVHRSYFFLFLFQCVDTERQFRADVNTVALIFVAVLPLICDLQSWT